ncbi:uncharacterized protein CEXT_584921 [Caerostris extrusa]|uniref:Gustatory receptor n=1 Tax=Caerostris extrusa TaxID=172846 RepID=A0AAV4SUP2_CAEEX|nr:uncharacterized protein CEXT_584921 [Caerostris extrusa]
MVKVNSRKTVLMATQKKLPKVNKNQEVLVKICKMVSFITAVTISPTHESSSNQIGSAKFWQILMRIFRSTAFVISFYYVHQLVSFYVALGFYSTDICGLILQVVLNAKRRQISNTLNMLSRVLHVSNPRCSIVKKYVTRSLILFLISVSVCIPSLIYFSFVIEWQTYKKSVQFPFHVPPGGLHDACLGFVLVSLIYSGASGGFTCALVSMLCTIIYLILSMIIASYRTSLKHKLKTQDLSAFIFNETKILKFVVTLVESVDRAWNLCAFWQYCELTSLIFIIVTIIISKSFSHSGLVNTFMVFNFLNVLYLFYSVTMNGSSVKREGEKLKKIGLECSEGVSRHSFLMSSEKERSFPSFSLLLENIRDNPLKVTAGDMFVIEKTIFLAMMNATVTYSIIMYQIA